MKYPDDPLALTSNSFCLYCGGRRFLLFKYFPIDCTSFDSSLDVFLGWNESLPILYINPRPPSILKHPLSHHQLPFSQIVPLSLMYTLQFFCSCLPCPYFSFPVLKIWIQRSLKLSECIASAFVTVLPRRRTYPALPTFLERAISAHKIFKQNAGALVAVWKPFRHQIFLMPDLHLACCKVGKEPHSCPSLRGWGPTSNRLMLK